MKVLKSCYAAGGAPQLYSQLKQGKELHFAGITQSSVKVQQL